MTRQQAQQMIASLVEMGECVNELTETISTIPDDEKQKSMRRVIGPVLAANYDLMEVILSEHPDLDPYIE